jgi:hypothetical protein
MADSNRMLATRLLGFQALIAELTLPIIASGTVSITVIQMLIQA